VQKLKPFHSVGAWYPVTYHDNSACHLGRRIRPENRRRGSGVRDNPLPRMRKSQLEAALAMPVLGFYRVTFTHRRDSRAVLRIDLDVGDGEHPVVARAEEHLATLGIDIAQWHVTELVELA
jgi:hypothetical protein